MGDLHDCLPRGSNVTKLIQVLRVGPIADSLKALFEAKNRRKLAVLLAIENNFAQAKPCLINRPGDEEWQKFFVPLLPPEKISCLISESDKICKLVCMNAHAEPVYIQAMHEVLRANTNRKLVKEIKKHLKGTNILELRYANLMNNLDFEDAHYVKGASNAEWDALVNVWKTCKMDTTPQRLAVYKQVHSRMPEELTAQQAQETLELLAIIMERRWADKLLDLRNLVGMINHCIICIHRETRLDWLEILKVYESCLGNVLAMLEKANLQNKVWCPLTKVPGIKELILERTYSGEVL